MGSSPAATNLGDSPIRSAGIVDKTGRSAAVNRNAVISIYEGKNPGDVPVYSISEAAHYLRLPTATIRSWAVGRQYPTRSGDADFRPLIDIADQTDPLLSFSSSSGTTIW
jgi:hypothetical protein